MAELVEMLVLAATALEDPAASRPEAVELLAWLGCPYPDPPNDAARHRARLLRAAAGFRRLFRLDAKGAPQFAAFGAEVGPEAAGAVEGLPVTGVAGGGMALLAAFERCAGEGIERLSAMESVHDQHALAPPPITPAGWLAAYPGLSTVSEWLPARRLVGGDGAVLLPAELCRWRPPGRRQAEVPFAASLGCAAGATVARAMLAGLCELVERDAAALWWLGGRRGRPLALEDGAAAIADLVLLRRGAGRVRRSWLLDLTTDLGIPVVAAVSCDFEGGVVSIGTAARPLRARAAAAAVRDLVLNELAVELVEAKRAVGGESALNAADHAHLQRSFGLHAARHAILHPVGAPVQAAEQAVADPLRWMLKRLAAAEQEVVAVDLTRPAFGVSVVRMLCPGLEKLPGRIVGARLQAACEAPGAERAQAEIALM